MKRLTQEQRDVIENKIMSIHYKMSLLRKKEDKLMKRLEEANNETS
jgi:hypothetical protein